jgi:hypothetical protein
VCKKQASDFPLMFTPSVDLVEIGYKSHEIFWCFAVGAQFQTCFCRQAPRQVIYPKSLSLDMPHLKCSYFCNHRRNTKIIPRKTGAEFLSLLSIILFG